MTSSLSDSGLSVHSDQSGTEARPVLLIGLGRGQTGKSAFLRWAIDRARHAGRKVVAADGDRSNTTLSAYYRDATRPEFVGDTDLHEWLNTILETMNKDRVSAAIDLGGGDRILDSYARELPLVEFCQECGIRPVAMYFVAPSVDCLAPIASLEKSGAFRPDDTGIVLNEGLVPFGHDTARAFDQVREHEIFRKVLERGADPVMMPRLGCMRDLERRRLGFFEPNHAVLGAINGFRVKHWLVQMEEAFAPLLGWLP